MKEIGGFYDENQVEETKLHAIKFDLWQPKAFVTIVPWKSGPHSFW